MWPAIDSNPSQQRHRPEGERKHITVLFSDLSGYTSLSEKLDPEEVKSIMNRIFGQITKVVSHHEGTIEKFIGDAVVAFFGIPKAHEDDPVRAIRTALEIHEIVRTISPEFEGQDWKAPRHAYRDQYWPCGNWQRSVRERKLSKLQVIR